MTPNPVLVELDGSHGEGGGSIVRTALAMSALTGQPVRIFNVRGGLPKPGVGPVDIALAQALGSATGALIEGSLGDSDLSFRPRTALSPVRDRIDLNRIAKGASPGSATLVLQSLLAPLSRAGGVSRVSVRGGTHIPLSPTYDYFRLVTIPCMESVGIGCVTTIDTASYGRGAGEIAAEIEPSGVEPASLSDRGRLLSLRATVVTSELPEAVGMRGVRRLENWFRRDGLECAVEFLKVRAPSPGAAVTIGAEFERGFGGGQALGERGRSMEQVVDEAYSQFIDWLNSDTGVDPFVADQLVVPCALAQGTSAFTTSRITPTLVSTIWVVKQFMPARIVVTGREEHAGSVSVG